MIHWRVLLCMGVAVLGGCSHGPSVRPAMSTAPASRSADIDAIVVLLNDGERDEARKRLRAILKRDPNDASAQVLADSIERDPVELLGPTSYPYSVHAGDTMIGLAERLLGNRLKFYQLARYNQIAKPSTLAAGQTLRIPGEAPRPTPQPRPQPQPARPVPTRPAPHATTTSAPRPKRAPVAAPIVPARNPAAANAARAAGLAALNGGRVGTAVQQLRRAAALDPASPTIARDLARAERIARTVQARR